MCMCALFGRVRMAHSSRAFVLGVDPRWDAVCSAFWALCTDSEPVIGLGLSPVPEQENWHSMRPRSHARTLSRANGAR